MYDVVILDDDSAQRDIELRAVAACPGADGLFRVKAMGDIDEFERYVSEGNNVDILVTDIVFGGEENAIDVVARLSSQGFAMQVIYVTGYIDYCTSVYRTRHAYFLTKPFDQRDFDSAISRCLDNLADEEKSRPLVLTSQGRVVCVFPDDIDYIESDRRKVIVHAGERVVESYASLSEIAEKVPVSFVRCHKSYLVNMDRIAELVGGEAVMRSGARVPVSQRYRRAMRDKFVGYLMAKS